MEFDLLCEDIQAEIFGRLPLEALNKCKLVSKKWKHMVCHLVFKRGSSGFIVPCHDNLELVTVKSGLANAADFNNILETNISAYRNRKFLYSCNGLLLFGGIDDSSCNDTHHAYRVCNPLLNQSVNLPRPYRCREADMIYKYNLGLAYDAITGRHHYKLVYMAYLRTAHVEPGIIEYEIFSSETWEWRQVRSRMFNSFLLGDFSGRNNKLTYGCQSPCSVYLKGALYWMIARKKCMLVYYVENEFFKLVKLPSYNTESSRAKDQLSSSGWLSESNERMYYCGVCSDEIYVWEYTSVDNNSAHDDDYDDSDENINKFWQLKHVANDGLDSHEGFDKNKISHCRFYSDLEVVYIQVDKNIYSYDFKANKLKEVWRKNDGVFYSYADFFPYMISLVDLPGRPHNHVVCSSDHSRF